MIARTQKPPFAKIMPQAGVLSTQGKRRLRSRFLTAMSKTAVHGVRTPYYGDAHIAPFTPAPAVLNLSLATSAGECAEAILLPSPRRGRMCASCRQPRCGFCARMSLAILHLQRKIADRSTSSHLCEKAPSNSEDFLPSVREKISEIT